MPDGLISARFEALDSITQNINNVMNQHQDSLDEQLRLGHTSEGFWEGQNNQDMLANLQQDQKIATEDVSLGHQQGHKTNLAREGYASTVAQCSAYFS